MSANTEAGQALIAVYVMWVRQLKLFFRAKSRVVGSIVQPLLWLSLFGLGWASAARGPQPAITAGVDYPSFLAPGAALMGVFFASFMAGIAVIWDREFGFLKEVLVAPVPREATILGRALGDSTIAILQGTIILIVAMPIAPKMRIYGLPAMMLVMFLVALSFTSLGIAIGSRMTSMEGFQLINTFISMPAILLSGVFFPVSSMPKWMKPLAMLDPLTYGVDAGRQVLVGIGSLPLWLDLATLALTSLAFVLLAVYMFRRATID